MKYTIQSFIRAQALPWLAQTKNYAWVVGVILFVIGLIGFAFRSDNSLPDPYLVGALILGFWGILSAILNGNGRVTVPVVPEPETHSSEEATRI